MVFAYICLCWLVSKPECFAQALWTCERLGNMKLINFPAGNRENGFSLIELLFAMGIFIIILAAITSVFIGQRKSYSVQEQVTEMT